MFIDKLILLNRAFLRAIEGRVKDTPDADLTLYVLDYLKYLGSLNATYDGRSIEKGVGPRPVKVLMQLRKKKANDLENLSESKLKENQGENLRGSLSPRVRVRSKRASTSRVETRSNFNEGSTSKCLLASIDDYIGNTEGQQCQQTSIVSQESEIILVRGSPRKRCGSTSDNYGDSLDDKTSKQSDPSTSYGDGDPEGLPVTFSFGTSANVSSTQQFLFGKDGVETMDCGEAQKGISESFDVGRLDELEKIVSFDLPNGSSVEYECGFPIYERFYHNDVRKLPISALFDENCPSEVCKNVPVVNLDGGAKELSFLISEDVPISDLPVDNLGCWNSKSIHMKKRNYYFKNGVLCTTLKEAADSFIERRQYNHAYADPYRSIIKVIWSAHLLDGTHRRSLITYRIERGASVPLRPYHLSKKSDIAYQRVFPSTLESITSCRQDLTPAETMSQLLHQNGIEESLDIRAVPRNEEQIYNRCSSRFPSSKYCGLAKRKDEMEEDSI